jgi:hypothetical protein
VNLRCPKCRTGLVQKSADGKVKIRTNLIAFDAHGAEAVCKKCGADIPLDVRLGPELRKALDGPRLIVRKVVDSSDSAP